MRSKYPALPLVFLVAGGLAACSDDSSPSTPDAPTAAIDAKIAPDAGIDAPSSSADAGTTALLQQKVETIVLIYAENRGFDNLYGSFPGANGIPATPTKQVDRDGTTALTELPRFWGGLTQDSPLQSISVTKDQTAGLANQPFSIPTQFPGVGLDIISADLVHRFFQNQMQIDGGKNDLFAAYSDAGGEVMGHYDGSTMALWKVASDYTLADNFYQAAFGGSFLNHQYLICACAPEYPNADTSPASGRISVVDKDQNGKLTFKLTLTAASPVSAIDGPPGYAKDGAISPKDYFGDGTFRGINTLQPAYQPSGNKPPASDTTKLLADPAADSTLPEQTETTIGDLLDSKSVSWAWYANQYNTTLAAATGDHVYEMIPGGNTRYQFHHHPFNYYARLNPITAAPYRATHLKDYEDLVAQAQAGTLPQVVFYKPAGDVNQHPGYANIKAGDDHIADLITKLKASPQYSKMVIVITYDENGGFWDHAAPPKADLLGPGSRIPAIIVSPLAKQHFIDHTLYDTSSFVRLVIRRFGLDALPGLTDRDAKLQTNGSPKIGDLTNALSL